MKKEILFIALLLTILASPLLYAQTGELDTSFSAVKSFFLPSLITALLVLFADAKKWMFSGEWSWTIFWNSKFKPFIFSMVGGIVLYFVLAFLPFTKPFIEVLGGSEFAELTAASFIGMATAIINGILKPTESEE